MSAIILDGTNAGMQNQVHHVDLVARVGRYAREYIRESRERDVLGEVESYVDIRPISQSMWDVKTTYLSGKQIKTLVVHQQETNELACVVSMVKIPFLMRLKRLLRNLF